MVVCLTTCLLIQDGCMSDDMLLKGVRLVSSMVAFEGLGWVGWCGVGVGPFMVDF